MPVLFRKAEAFLNAVIAALNVFADEDVEPGKPAP